ncbi:hypothetical protein [Ferroglobus sp.]|uniref:hypothetical protein n=1 Tax=Ferroglobus sp. TaxID=2614230 RepID=UPI0025BF5546|nr:hypothetical protein [Ferroglobus sp.]
MRISVDIPADIEEKLLKKCEELGVSPSEFISALLEWYFLKRKKEVSGELEKYAKKYGTEKMKNCKYSDGKICALEALTDLEAEVEPLNVYKCLFCSYFVDKRKEHLKKKENFEIVEIAKMAAKIVIENYGDRLGYVPEKKRGEKSEIKDVRKIIESW